ncbi:acyltransferase family-domain-containing protein [Chaetomidium leptoderma]|uniref:Acyltransferase family-domain-containing protein n=1 Tax=Chaetomidium leptoderma TaxID=669021 RepID=A0AAN6VCS0_9PEZI|nr:acyltransferase family-domain-containing protein [Chaetomidium leptoderma]
MLTPSGHRRGTSSTSSITALLLPRRQPWLRFLRALLPSFVADTIFPETHHHHRPPLWRLHPTSYLDGLRGIAAIIVFFCHYTETNFPWLTPAYGGGGLADEYHGVGGGGYNTTTMGYNHHNTTTMMTMPPPPPPSSSSLSSSPTSSSFIQLPFLRVLYSGRPMVHIFFVISGFALSYKPVRALHAAPRRDVDKCYAALASSAFRRALRLFGPCVVSTFFVMCLRQMGLLRGGKKTLAAELWKWKGAVLNQVAWPWDWDRDLRPAYDVHLWTIPIEFAHSMLLFMVLLMLARVRLRLRMAAVFGLMVYCLACGKWAGFEFLTGLFLAEVHVLLAAARAKEWEGDSETHRSRRDSTAAGWALKMFQIGLVLLGLFLAGWPNGGADKTPGIRWFLAQTPMPFAKMDHLAPQKFWFGLSAAVTVWAVGDLGFLRRLFESPVAQYCGRISYAVYICHGPVEDLFRERLLGYPTIPAQGEPGAPGYQPALAATGVKGLIGVETMTQITMSWFVGLWVLGPLVIWAADLFWRAVDSQIVSLARRLETLCLDDTEPSPRSQGYSLAA